MNYISSKNKFNKKILLILISSVILLICLLTIYVRKSLPPYKGEVLLKNLSSKVIVDRDKYGIPHIFANSNLDGFRALGFIMASERLFQMEVERRMAYGELAEIFGEKALPSDKLFRTLGIKNSISEMLQNKIKNHLVDQEMWDEVSAFYDGVNQFQDSGHLPIEFSILGIKPRPFTVYDGYAFMGLMSFSFGVATSEEPLLTRLQSKIDNDLWVDLRNDPILDKNTRNLNNSFKQKQFSIKNNLSPVVKIISELENGFPLFEGSNAWLISSKRSASGFPILANDPHISFSHPGVWFEAHLKTPTYESYGHFLSIIPFPILSHNLERGWGMTMSLVDDMDLYKEEINPKFKTYKFKQQNIFYHERLEKILVRGSKPHEMIVNSTHHGPILDEVFSSPEEKSLAISWAFLSPKNDPLFALFKMGRAKNMYDFKSAVSLGVAPGLNILYADKKNIGCWIFGEIRHRSTRQSSDVILDGSSGLDELKEPINFIQKPHLENPSNGIIVSANARPEGLPSDVRGDWQPDDRQKTIESILMKKANWSIDENKKIQTANYNLENKLILTELLRNLELRNLWSKDQATTILLILKDWNFSSEMDSIAPSIYYTWCREIIKLLLANINSEDLNTFSRLPNSWIFFKKIILDNNSKWWGKFKKKKIISDAFVHAIESLRQQLGEDSRQWRWGHLHTLEFMHPLGRLKPLDLIFNIGPVEIGGAYNEINNQKSSGFLDGFKIKAGPSTRRLVDFARPDRALGVLPTGNSGHIFSPFYKDQLSLYTKGEYRDELMSEKDIKKNISFEMVLVPR